METMIKTVKREETSLSFINVYLFVEKLCYSAGDFCFVSITRNFVDFPFRGNCK